MKSKSVYATTDDIIEFAKKKYQLNEMKGYSMSIDWLGNYNISFQGNRYTVEADEAKNMEKEYISEYIL